jgi:hypothetical protein
MLPALLLALCLAWALPVAAEAAPLEAEKPEHLTSQGRWMVTGSLGAHYTNDDSYGLGAKWRWGVSASPGLSYFVRDHIGVGLFGAFGYREAEQLTGSIDETDGGVGARMMFDVPLAKHVSVMLWPWFSYHWAVRDRRTPSALPFEPFEDRTAPVARTAETLRYAQAALFVPLLFHAAANVGIGLGPYVTFDFAMKRTLETENFFSSPAQGATAQQQAQLRSTFAQPSQRVTTGLMSTILASF